MWAKLAEGADAPETISPPNLGQSAERETQRRAGNLEPKTHSAITSQGGEAATSGGRGPRRPPWPERRA
jgi:hypothetical protein